MIEEIKKDLEELKDVATLLGECKKLRKGERAAHMTHAEKVECFRKCISAVLHDDIGQPFLPEVRHEAQTLANRASRMAYERYFLTGAWAGDEKAWQDANESMGWPFMIKEG